MVCDVGGMHKLFEVTYIKWPFYWFVPFTKIYSMRHQHSYVLCQLSFKISLFINNHTLFLEVLENNIDTVICVIWEENIQYPWFLIINFTPTDCQEVWVVQIPFYVINSGQSSP